MKKLAMILAIGGMFSAAVPALAQDLQFMPNHAYQPQPYYGSYGAYGPYDSYPPDAYASTDYGPAAFSGEPDYWAYDQNWGSCSRSTTSNRPDRSASGSAIVSGRSCY